MKNPRFKVGEKVVWATGCARHDENDRVCYGDIGEITAIIGKSLCHGRRYSAKFIVNGRQIVKEFDNDVCLRENSAVGKVTNKFARFIGEMSRCSKEIIKVKESEKNDNNDIGRLCS